MFHNQKLQKSVVSQALGRLGTGHFVASRLVAGYSVTGHLVTGSFSHKVLWLQDIRSRDMRSRVIWSWVI
jgi:hypothetical protein